MKKKIFAVVIIIALILLVLLLLRACEPRQKLNEEEVLSAFVQANIQFACEVQENPVLLEDDSVAKNRVNEIYTDWGLPAEDDELMLQILQQYENDPQVTDQIRSGVESAC